MALSFLLRCSSCSRVLLPPLFFLFRFPLSCPPHTLCRCHTPSACGGLPRESSLPLHLPPATFIRVAPSCEEPRAPSSACTASPSKRLSRLSPAASSPPQSVATPHSTETSPPAKSEPGCAWGSTPTCLSACVASSPAPGARSLHHRHHSGRLIISEGLEPPKPRVAASARAPPSAVLRSSRSAFVSPQLTSASRLFLSPLASSASFPFVPSREFASFSSRSPASLRGYPGGAARRRAASASSAPRAQLLAMAAACSSLGGWVRRAFSSSAAHASFNSKPDGVLTLASAASSPSPSSSTSASPVSRDAAEQHARTNTTRNAEDLVEGGDGAEEAGGVEPTAAQQGQGWAPNRGVKERHFQKKGCEKRANGRPVPESDEPLETPTPDGVVIPHVHQHSASCASPCAPPDTSFRRDLDERGRWRDEELTRGWLDVRRLKRQVEAEAPALGAQKEEAGGRHTQPSESAVAGNARGRFEPRDREPPEPPNSHTEATLAAASNGGEKPDEWNMRVMTFNILADSLTDYKYRFLDQSIVKWASRANVIETEIFRHRPAICCLQELDATHYHKRFRPFFASLGYDGVYKQKTNGRQDGVGTFWLRSRYELVEQHDVEFSQQSKGLVNKPQVGLVLLLRERVGLAETSAGADGRERIPRTKSSEAASCSSPEAVSPPPSEASRSPVSPFPSRLRFEAAGEETPSSVAHVAWGAGLLHAASVSKRRRGGEERGAQRSVDGRDADAGRRHDATSLDQTRVDPRDEEAAAAQHGRMIIVGNTHLLFDSRRGDIKLAQLLLLLQAVYALRQRALAMIAANLRQQIMRGRETHSPASLDSENERKRRFESYKRTDAPSPARDREGARSTASPLSRSTSPPSLAGAESGEVAEGGGAEKAAERLLDMLLCGDFNFTPQSPLYQLVLQGSFDFSGLDHRKLSGQFLMERHTYRMDAQGYQGRGATIVSTPSESQRITCLDAQQFVRAHMRAAAPLPHSHSEPSRMAETAACLCHGAKPHLAASLAADAAALPPSSSRGSLKLARQTSAPLPQWLQELHRVLGNASLRGGLSPSDLSRSTSLPSATGNPRDTGLRDLRTQPSCAASVITLPLKFNSAYALPKLQRPPKGGATQASHVVMEEPAFTAYHGWQKGCIDYIFYHSEALEVARIYQLPVLAQAKSHGCCPNKLWPCSDHYSLVTDFVKCK